MPDSVLKKSVFFTKDMPLKNGRTLYSESLIEVLEEKFCINVQKLSIPVPSKSNKLILRLIFFFLLLPSLWIDSLLRFKQIKEKISGLDKKIDTVFLDHFQLWWLIFILKKKKNLKIILVSHNLEFRNKLSFLKYGSIPFKLGALLDVVHLYLWESLCSRISNGVICINSDEEIFFQRHGRENSTSLVFPFIKKEALKKLEKDSFCVPKNNNEILLVGSFGYKAKELNVVWLIKSIMSKVYAFYPEMKLTIVGRGGSNQLKKLSKSKVNVNFEGEVDVLKEFYERASLVVIPERLGGGFKLKIIEAMVFQKPILIHREATKGTYLRDGIDCLIFDSADDFIVQLGKIYNNKNLQMHLVENAKKTLLSFHQKENALNVLNNLFIR